MLSVLKAAWRVVARRAVADKAILFASFATILLAITLMAAGPIYADSVTISSLRRTLVDAPIATANLAITTRVTPDEYRDTDDKVFSLVNEAFEGIGGQVYRRGTSDSQSIVGLGEDHDEDLVVFRFFTGMEEHSGLVAGAWPTGGSAPMEVAVPETVAENFGLEVGSVVEIEGRSHGSVSQRVEVVGIYEIASAADPYWLEDPLDIQGVEPATTFTTYGPFVVTADDFFTKLGQESSEVRWAAFPNYDQIDASDVAPILGHLDALDTHLNSTRELGNLMQIDTGLGTVLRETQRSQLVTRSAVLVLTIQLAILAGYALLLAAGLLADTREIETTTLRARGASSAQLLAMSVMEGLLLVVPALAIGPPLAGWLLRSFNQVGPLAGIGLGIEPVVNIAAWALAGVAALGCIVALVVPAYRSARRSGNVRATRSRQGEQSLMRRAGADLALLAVAAVGLWQLSRYGAPITRDVQGRLGVDPLLVAAPAIALLAGAALALRALPLLARLAEVGISKGRKLVASLGIWYLGRQPRRYARSALMLILAVAIGVFALSYDATWQTSQNDQANFSTGADVMVTPDRRAGTAIPDHVLIDAYADLEGEIEAVPVARSTGQISGAGQPVQFVLVEPEGTADVISYRPDQATNPIGGLLEATTANRPPETSPLLEGEPTRVAVTAALQVGPIPPDLPEQSSAAYDIAPTLRVVFADAAGIPFRVDLGVLDQSGASVRLEAPIDYLDDSGRLLTPDYPLRLVGLEVREMAPFHPYVRDLQLDLDQIELTQGDGWDTFEWPTGDSVTVSNSELRLAGIEPTVALATTGGGTSSMRMGSGTTGADSRQPSYYMLWMAPPAEVDQIPVLVSSRLLAELGLRVGDPIPLGSLTGYDGAGLIAGEFTTFPTVDPASEHAIVLDYATYLAAAFGPGVFPPEPENYWISVGDPSMEAMADRLRDSPYDSVDVVTRTEALADLALDPVSLGTIGSLMMGLIAAAILAGIGFLVNVVVSTRERLGQFALMRAIGLSKGQVLSWVTIENGVTVVFSLIFGTLLGLVLSNIVLPLTAITQRATAIVPELVVIHPWPQIAILQGVVVIALGAAVVIVAQMLDRLQLAALLRTGEE